MNKDTIDNLLDKYILVSEAVHYAVVDSKAVILIPGENSFYTLNTLGTKIWELADGSLTVKKIVESICKEFEVNEDIATRDIVRFIEDLSKIHLLCLAKEKR